MPQAAEPLPAGIGGSGGCDVAARPGIDGRHLGFDGATANSIDATSDRDFALEFVNVLSLLAMHLSRWAEEMILFSSQEYSFLGLPEAYSTGSSAMPQKKNPDLLELVRGKSGRVLGNATALMVAMKGLPLAYNKDLQETQEPLFDSSDTLLQMLPLVTGWMKAVEFQYRAHAAGRAIRIHECVGGRDVPGEARRPFAGSRTSGLARQCRFVSSENCELARLVAGRIASAQPGFR